MKYALILTTALVFTACSPSADSTPTSETVKSASEAKPTVKIIRAKTEHVAKSDPYTLTWETIPADRPVRIEVSSDPEAKLGAGELVTEDAQGSFTWITEEPLKRHYFTLIPESGDPVKTAVRLLPLEGGRNFRDIGGYKTKDGKSVKWGQVFRSGTMVGLTDTDYDYLSSAGIAVICDFRSESERKNEPTNWQAPNGEYVTFPDAVGEMGMMSGFMEILKGPDPSPEKISKVMADSYPDMAKQYAPHYTEVFDRLAGGDIPLAFNCSAGKDRAGTSAALILTALGVPKETVVEDYALSEAYVDYMEEFSAENYEKIPDDHPYAFLKKIPKEMLVPLMRSDPKYIKKTLETLEMEYGSIEGFLKEEVGVTDAELQTIRSELLE